MIRITIWRVFFSYFYLWYRKFGGTARNNNEHIRFDILAQSDWRLWVFFFIYLDYGIYGAHTKMIGKDILTLNTQFRSQINSKWNWAGKRTAYTIFDLTSLIQEKQQNLSNFIGTRCFDVPLPQTQISRKTVWITFRNENVYLNCYWTHPQPKSIYSTNISIVCHGTPLNFLSAWTLLCCVFFCFVRSWFVVVELFGGIK